MLTAAGRALGGARLADPQPLKSWARNDVWRCRVIAGPQSLPASIIVKHFKAERDRGFDDWASLEFLTRAGAAPALGPRFLAGDATARVFVTEDLGAGRTLEDVLTGSDDKTASDAVVTLAQATGRLHAATLDHHAEFDRLRDALAPRELTPISRAAAVLRAAEPALTGWLAAVGARVPRGLADGLAALADAVEQPGAFTAFTHGDMAPSNNHISAVGLRLLDFEYGGVRSALYDSLFWNLFCPLPPALIERADAAYRRALAATCTAALDDAVYAAARSVAVAWRTVNMLQWFGPEALERDGPWAPGLTVRQASLWHVERFMAFGIGGSLAAMTDAVDRLAHALGARWRGERERMYVWPAFRTAGQS